MPPDTTVCSSKCRAEPDVDVETIGRSFEGHYPDVGKIKDQSSECFVDFGTSVGFGKRFTGKL